MPLNSLSIKNTKPIKVKPISYAWLEEVVRQRFASKADMEAFLPQPLSSNELAALGDDRYLSAMSLRVFQAGMTHKVVNSRWPNFEQAFWGFDPEKIVLLTPEQIDKHAANADLIRHRTKMATLPVNARFILDIRQETGASFAEFIANWPVTEITQLWQLLAKRGSRLGGRSAAGFLRLMGKDTFLLTSDVVARLESNGLLTASTTSKQGQAEAQAVFNQLHQASGRPLCQLSAMLSLSINPRF